MLQWVLSQPQCTVFVVSEYFCKALLGTWILITPIIQMFFKDGNILFGNGGEKQQKCSLFTSVASFPWDLLSIQN